MTILEKFNLSGKVAVVTGGAGLLGAEFCRTLAQAGAAVAVVDNNTEAAIIVSRDLTTCGYQALAVPADITKPGSVHAMQDAILEAFGRLDILVNSAALDPKFDVQHTPPALSGAFEDFPLETWQQAMDVNLTGMFLVCQAAVRCMLAQAGGVIINVSSMYGMVGPDQRLYQHKGHPPRYKPVYYSVTKAGVLGLTKYLAAYYAGRNIRVNALTPGGVFNGQDETFLQEYSARAVLGRMAEKDEMNGALLFLATQASSYMTGANLVVDGGWTAW
jgi:NAD(P)-dependent dehydrogenase (short-subunit alcohol dehydrogenase family)